MRSSNILTTWQVVFVLLALFTVSVSAKDSTKKDASEADASNSSAPSDVLVLTEKNFKEKTANEEVIMVEFYAPWCGHCKALAPEYEIAAKELKPKNLKIAKVDCTAEMTLCEEYGVKGYPTLKVFRNGSPSEYSGARKADAIVSYMNKQSLPAVSELSDSTHDDFSTSDKVVVILYAAGKDKVNEIFTQVAEKMRDEYLFGSIDDVSVAKAAGVSAPAVVLYKKFDEGKNIFKDVSKLTVSSLTSFVKENSFPVFAEIGPDNFAVFADSGTPLAYLFIDPEDPNLQDTIKELTPVANENKGKLHFVWIDGVKYVEHGKSLNLMKSTLPAFVIQEVEAQKKYPLEQSNTVSLSSVKKHVDAYLSGSMQPSVKSAPIPDTQDEAVYVLVADAFDEVVNDESKDVFVEFYAPWCGHCKKLKPIWDELAEKYSATHKNLIIAKQDMTENDLSDSAPFKVSGFPTLKFKKSGPKKEWVSYEGDRSLESLIEFLEENITTEAVKTGKNTADSSRDEL